MLATRAMTEIVPTPAAAALLEWLSEQQPSEVAYAKVPKQWRGDLRTFALCDRAGWVEWGKRRAYYRREIVRKPDQTIDEARDVLVPEAGWDEPFGPLSGPRMSPINLTLAQEERRPPTDHDALHLRLTADGYAALALCAPAIVEK